MVITAEQKTFLKKYINNLDALLIADDVGELLLAIDDAIVDTFDANYRPSEDGVKLQGIFDDIDFNN